ncbi:FtsX-like permease family protein [Fulvivirga ligni]|uniref:FtsX-like permease family protein n=1 Tax=Fulvivirga ligni TaxID=2904246 RepID=UPI001F260CDD|nr:FtsX-like permease family protein [Fulvivirga ligni]UII19404.1 permease prefix domain 2-containing transporter [Fulvivirga ligni]
MITPPKWMNTPLRMWCKPELLEEIEGDLLEYYGFWIEEYGQRKANRLYAWHALKFLRPFALKKVKSNNSNPINMLQHALLIAFRNFRKHSSSFLINLLGLCSGLTCVLIIYLWVNDELSIDKFHKNDQQLYQVMQNKSSGAGITTVEWTPGLLANALATEMPEVEQAVTVMSATWFPDFALSEKGEEPVKAKGQFAGIGFFQMFSFDLTQGDANQLFLNKNEVVISEDLARQIFNTTENIIGKTLEWKVLEFSGVSTITGICKNVPKNSTQQFDFVLPIEKLYEFIPRFNGRWAASGPDTYLLLAKGTDVSRFNAKISDFLQSKDQEIEASLFVRSYADRYLYGNYENGQLNGGRIAYVKLFSSIAILILFIACINFTNLTTANASRRAKEVGVKKVVGAHRSTLIFQYLIESSLLAFMSLIMAIALVTYLLPGFNSMAGKAIQLHFNTELIIIIFSIALVTGLLAGSYPALYLSRFSPGKILKGQFKTSIIDFWARKGLVTFQFATSIILIIAVLVVYKQTSFIQTANIGFEKDNVIYINNEGASAKNLDTFLAELKNVGGVLNASSTTHIMTGKYMSTDNLRWPAKTNDISFEMIEGNYDLIETLNIPLKEGRSFSRTFGNESDKIIFNERAIEMMGLEDPIGKKIGLFDKECEIIGITKDFHLESFHESIKPAFFVLNSDHARILILKIQSGQEHSTLERLSKFYKSQNPDLPFEYHFLDDNFQKLYVSEQRVSTLTKYFAALACLISCLGLLGLSAFNAERRMKEIGIRKILGSSVLSIVRLISGEFTKIILLANVVALPISYLITKHWLSDFAYRIDLEWWFFAASGLSAILVAWLIVGWQTLKVARINPMVFLRKE